MSHKRTRVAHMSLLVIGLSILSCLAVLMAAEYLVSTRTQSVQAVVESVSLVAEGNMKTGTLNQDLEKRQEKLNQMVEEGVLVSSVNAIPLMNNRASTANLLTENPPGNGKRFMITIQRNNTEEVIYQPGYLGPEQYIDDVSLGAVLPKGEHLCTTYLGAYRIEDNTRIGRAGAEIRLYVLEWARIPSGHRVENRGVKGDGDSGKNTNQRELRQPQEGLRRQE